MEDNNTAARSAIAVVLALTAGLIASKAKAQAAYTTDYRYNTANQLTGTISPDPDGAGLLAFAAVRYSYDNTGQVVRIEKGQLSTWQPANIDPALWTGFTVFRREDYTYDQAGRKLSSTASSNGTTYALSQMSYDFMGRLECSAVRMNSAAFSSPPLSACQLGTQGTDGPDRITKNSYDTRGRLTSVVRAYGTPSEQGYVTYTYDAISKPSTMRDSNGNLSSMEYDAANRLQRLNYPSPTTPGQVNTSDYEFYTYDGNGNRRSKRTRDGQSLTYDYDALSRLTLKTPSVGSSVHYDYDLRGLQTFARFDSPTGLGITSSYDGFGRIYSSTNNLGGFSRTVSFLHDANSNKTRITHPDGAYFVYVYDGLNRVKQIQENGTTLVAEITYDAEGRRKQLTFGSNGVSTVSYGYDAGSRPETIAHNLDGATATNDVAFSFAYNAASQVKTRTLSNDSYEFGLGNPGTTTYGVNGLNQYTSLSGVSGSLSSDARGNLTFDGATTYSYDIENRLTSATGSNPGNLAYDSLGRLWQASGGASGTTQFLYDGVARIAEYNSSGTLLRRYVHGPGVDEPVVWYEGSAVSSTTRRYMHADHQGSIIAVATSTGAKLQINRFDSFGTPSSGQTTPFQYTGQAWLSDQKLHYYKARVYSPTLGRFLQTDPVGYDSDLNLYAYGAGDPINRKDPSGLTCTKNDGAFICKVDKILDSKGIEIDRSKLTSSQQEKLSAFEASYSKAVNYLATHGGNSHTLKIPVIGADGQPTGRTRSATITAGSLAKALANRTFIAEPFKSGGTALARTLGPTTVHENGLSGSGLSRLTGGNDEVGRQITIAHEGIHGMDEEAYLSPSGLMDGPLNKLHQDPYNAAAMHLLGVSQ